VSKISIITPLYNGIKTLPETIESVLKQDYAEWEWILFDDGSNDGCQQVARKFNADYPGRIFYYEHAGNKNFGTAYTRNRAIEKSSGEIIAFLDQDDVWYENRLSAQLKVFDKMKNCAMIWSPALYWYKERSFKQPVEFKGKELESGTYEQPEFVKIFLSDLKGTPLPGASLVRRNFFDEVNGFEESIRGAEDIVLWLKLANKFPIYYLDEILIKYRRHQESTLRKARESGKMDEWNLIFYKWVINFLNESKADKKLSEQYEFAYYMCLKRNVARKNYFESRMDLIKGLNISPELKRKFLMDYMLDLVLPLDLATKVSAKLRFDWFKNN